AILPGVPPTKIVPEAVTSKVQQSVTPTAQKVQQSTTPTAQKVQQSTTSTSQKIDESLKKLISLPEAVGVTPPKRTITMSLSKTTMTVGDVFTVSGYVREDGRAVPGASVVIEVDGLRYTRTTDSSGRYEANIAAPKEGTLTVRAVSGVASTSQAIRVNPRPAPAAPPEAPKAPTLPLMPKLPTVYPTPQVGKRTITISLSPTRVGWGYTFTVSGYVREDGKGVPNAQVTITTDTTPPLSYTRTTDSSGKYEAVISSALSLPALKPGETAWTVTVTARSGDASASAKLTIEPSDIGPPGYKKEAPPAGAPVVLEKVSHPSGDVQVDREYPFEAVAHIVGKVDYPVIGYKYVSGPAPYVHLVGKGGQTVAVAKGGTVAWEITPNTVCTRKSTSDSVRGVKFYESGTYTVKVIAGRRVPGVYGGAYGAGVEVQEYSSRTFTVNAKSFLGKFTIREASHPSSATAGKPVPWHVVGQASGGFVDIPGLMYQYIDGPAAQIQLTNPDKRTSAYLKKGEMQILAYVGGRLQEGGTIDSRRRDHMGYELTHVIFPEPGTDRVAVHAGVVKSYFYSAKEFVTHDRREYTVKVAPAAPAPPEVAPPKPPEVPPAPPVPGKEEQFALQSSKEKIRSELASARRELDDLMREISSLRGDQSRYGDLISRVQGELSRLEAEAASLKSQLESMRSGGGLGLTREFLQQQIDYYRRLVQSLEGEVSSLRAERDSLRSQLESLMGRWRG
ncbi:MAG: hypothetical protein QXP81_10970, partial [Nitrososphaerota archaeon]